jgi:hypothetical protein
MFGIACFGGTPLLSSTPGGGGGGDDGPGIYGAIRDNAVRLAARDILLATGKFAKVECGTDLYDFAIPSDITDYCLIYRGEWKEKDDATSFDSDTDECTLDIPHMGYFNVVIGVRHDDKTARDARLSRLEFAAMNALDGSTLNGLVYRTFTKIVSGKPKMSVFPNAATILQCEYQWIVDGADGHDETDTEQFI